MKCGNKLLNNVEEKESNKIEWEHLKRFIITYLHSSTKEGFMTDFLTLDDKISLEQESIKKYMNDPYFHNHVDGLLKEVEEFLNKIIRNKNDVINTLRNSRDKMAEDVKKYINVVNKNYVEIGRLKEMIANQTILNEKMMEGLHKYGKHLVSCDVFDLRECICTCGFNKVKF